MSAELEELTRVAGELNPIQLRVLLNFARMLKYAPDGAIDMSDLTAEDKRAIAHATLRRFDEEHPDEDWGELRDGSKRSGDELPLEPELPLAA